MKKILFALTVLLIVSIMTGEALGQTTINDGTLYYKITNTTKKTVEVVYNENYLNMTSVIIPSSVTYKNEKYSVSTIGKKAFYKSKSLIQVSIPKTIITVGDSAFAECNNLNQVIFNGVSSLKEIGVQAFGDCSSLENLNIPSSVTSLKNKSFYRCINLKNVQFDTPSSLTAIGSQTFRRCYSLEKINLPLSITQINTLAFANCVKLKEITGIQNVKTINSYAFYGCYYLETISNLEKLETLGENAFRQCARLRELHIPSTLTSIGNLAFSGNTTIICDDNSYVKKWISNANNCPYFTLFSTNLNDVAETDSRNVDFFCNTGWTQGNNDDEDFMLTAVPTLDNNYPHGMERLGCWATALSQILYNLQVVPTGKVSYTYKTVNLQSDVDFGAEKIDFSKIVNEIDATSTDDEKRMTSLYSWYCLAALGNKGDEYSSDYYTRMLEKYYPVTTSEIFYPSTNNKNDVETFICNQLQNNRLIMVYRDGVSSRSGQPNGHAFVLDGIRFVDDIPYVHFNFGWAHNNDGWYDLWANSWTTSQIDLDGEKIYLMGIEKKPEINNQITSLNIVIPNKVDYAKDEDFDKKGLKVFANYSDGTKKEITDYEVTGFNSKTNGEKYVTVNYDGLSARFKVFVGQSYPSYRRHINLEQEMSGGSLPSKVDLTQYLPPVKSQWWLYDDNGNQLSYNGKLGTCLAWAFGYYNRTYLRAKNLNLSKTDLEKPENQFSPKDLYMVISAGQKTWSQGLNGTETMDMLSTRGIASMKTVPYRNFEDSVYLRDNELIEAEAAEYKITSYDQIVSGFTKNAIKSALNKGHLIVFSANIGTDFKKGYGNKNSSHAMPYANYDFTSTGRHVMTICGYDDSKGEHGAFKVVNSYGPDWCEDGFIWIDQDFFTDNYAITDSKGNALGFCNYYAYIMHANDRVVSSLTAKNDITTYYVGDEFNKSGLTVTANYSDGSSATVSDYELSGFDSKTTGTKTITVSYKGKSTTFQITVKENNSNLHSITYIVDGEVYMSLKKMVVHGSRMIMTNDPSKVGYTFDGWFTEDGKRYNFETGIVNDDVTLYAHWNVATYSITYDLDDGVLTNNNPSTYTVETEDFALNNPTKEGFEFVGWTGTDLTTASNNVVIRKGSTGDRDYVAVWKEIKVYIHPEHNYNAYITGKVLDADNNPLENALVTSGNSIPQIMVGTTGSMTDEGYYITDDWSSIEFTATKKFLTQVDVLLNISGDPGKISIAIANYDDYNIIWGKMFYQERITNNDWTSINIDDIIEVVPGQKYYLSFKADTYNSDARTYYAIFEDSNTEPMYKIWGNDDPIVRSDSEGDYYFPFEDNWAGTLRAFYSDKQFNKLSFSKVISSVDGMDFVENGADKTFNETLPLKHTIQYIVDGKIHMQLKNAVVHGSRMISTNDPEKEGYIFEGWFTADGEKYDFETGIVNSDITLYAHWNIVEYTITYNLDGGKLSQTNPKSFTVETSDFTLNNPTKTGYTFVGWTGTGLANATTTAKISKGSTSDRTYTAKWQINQYTITFDTDGGTKLDAITAEYGKKITQSKNPAKEGYTFAGWDYLPETMPARNITAKAQWNINIHKLSYKVDNEPYGETESVEFGSIIRTKAEPVKTGHTFSGWQNVPTAMPDKDVTITGTFRVNTHTLTYMVDGKIYGETEIIAYGKAIKLRANPIKEGFTFSGWSSHPDEMPDRDLTISGNFEVNKHKVTYIADGIVHRESNVDFGSVIPSITAPTKIGYTFAGWSPELPATMPDYDIKVTAQWKPNQYTITFDTDGGTEVSNITADFGSSIKKPDNPTKVGYTFDGWYPEIPSVMNSDLTCKAYWKVNSYTITFNTEGGTTVSNITNYYGSKVSKPADPTKKGYTFGGWKPEIPTTMPAEDMIVSAVWLEADQYTVTFDTDGGNYIPSIVGYAGDPIPSISNPTKEGYTFNGWDRQIPSAIPSENITITATWKVNQYTLSFDTDGGNTISSIKVDYGSKIPSVTNPTKIGHTFDGWNIDLTALTMPANNLTVKALWKKEQYSVTFDTDGGNYIAPIKADYGAEVAAPQKPSKEGYEFDGWSVNFPTRITSDLTVTAKWRVKKYTITFDTDGGTEISTITQDFGTTIATPTAPTKAGYTFGGWTPQLPTTMPAQNVNVTAIWLRDNQYKITFDTDGGSSVTPGAYYFGETISVPTSPTKTGYIFVGWNPAIPSTMPAENLTVKAQWKAIEYTITFDTDGGNAIAPITTYYGAEITAPSTNPTKEGCTFDGWNYDFPFSMPANNLTIKAKWKGGIYKVQFDDFSFELAYGAAIPKISEPKKDGYTFTGWDGKVPETMPAKDLVFKSQWKKEVKLYTITYYVDDTFYYMQQLSAGDPIKPIELPDNNDESKEYTQWQCEEGGEIPQTMPENNIVVKTSLVTSASELSVPNIRIWAHAKTIYVVNAKSTIQIIDISGRVIAIVEPVNSRMEIPFYHKSGIYVVKTYGKMQKVFIE